MNNKGSYLVQYLGYDEATNEVKFNNGANPLFISDVLRGLIIFDDSSLQLTIASGVVQQGDYIICSVDKYGKKKLQVVDPDLVLIIVDNAQFVSNPAVKEPNAQ